MAITVGTLVVELLGKGTKKLQRDFKQIEVSATGLRNALASVTAIGVGLGFVGKKVFDLGSSIAEIESKFKTVFGAASASVNQFVENFGALAGLSKSQAQDLIATTGAIAQGMGFAEDASAKFAIEITKVAGDLASFNDLPTADTLLRIQAALTGERESLKRLGIVILETDVQQRALNRTGKENAKQLTQQEKATATLELITERAGVAMGDLARTQESAANQAKRIGAEFRNVAETFATDMLPVLSQMLPLFRELATNAAAFAAEASSFFTTLIDSIGLTDPVIRKNIETFNKLSEARKRAFAENLREEIAAKRSKIARLEHIKALSSTVARTRSLAKSIKELEEGLDSETVALDIMETALQRIDAAASNATETFREFKAVLGELPDPEVVAIPGGERGGPRAPQIPPPRMVDPFADAMERAETAIANMRPILDQVSRTITDLILGFQSFGDVIKRVGVLILDSIVGAIVQAIAKAIILNTIFGGAGLPVPGFSFFGGILSAQKGITLPGGGSGGIPILAHPGEAVLNRQAVQALGGAGAIDAINKMGAGGGLTINADFSRVPTPVTAREIALDSAWQDVLRETLMQLENGGFRFA